MKKTNNELIELSEDELNEVTGGIYEFTPFIFPKIIKKV